MKFFYKIAAVLFLGLLIAAGAVDTNAITRSKIIINFTIHIEWPSESKSGDFVIGFYGYTNVYDEVLKVSGVRKVQTQTIQVKKYSNLSDIDTPHILYVADEKKAELDAINKKIGKNSTLVITETPGIARKSCVNFIALNNRQEFQLNKEAAEARNLKVGQILERFAKPLD